MKEDFPIHGRVILQEVMEALMLSIGDKTLIIDPLMEYDLFQGLFKVVLPFSYYLPFS